MADRPLPVLFERLFALHRCLDAAGFDHAIGGALALGVHILEPRATYDIDLNVIANPLRPEPLLECLPKEVEIPDTAPDRLRRDGQMRLVWPDPTTAVDLFLPQHPTYHHLVVSRAEQVDFFGEPIKVISGTDLAVFKALFNRRKDWSDVYELHNAQAADFDEVIRWVGELVGADDRRIPRLREIASSERVMPGDEMQTFRWPGKD